MAQVTPEIVVYVSAVSEPISSVPNDPQEVTAPQVPKTGLHDGDVAPLNHKICGVGPWPLDWAMFSSFSGNSNVTPISTAQPLGALAGSQPGSTNR